MQPKSDQKSESDSSLIILASGSESRKIMLTDAGLSFDVKVSDVDEGAIKTLIDGMPFEKQVIELAKALASSITCFSNGIPSIKVFIAPSSTSDTFTSKDRPASVNIIFLLSDPEAKIISDESDSDF